MARGPRGLAAGMRPVSEADRISIMDRLQQFREGSLQEMTFEADLSNHDRAVVHTFCKKMGFTSKSYGKGSGRCVTVYKSRVEKRKAGGHPATPISFSQDTQQVLVEVFSKFPPTENEFSSTGLEQAAVHSATLTVPQEKVQCLFMKPAEIDERVKSLANQKKTVGHLRLIEQARQKLPIAAERDSITSAVDRNQVVIIAGETGCGKSTQVPQFLLDHMWSQRKPCRVLCTQPRRISATSVADRVAVERGEHIGETVGYQIRLENKGGPHSSLMFCTNGVLLRKLVSSKVQATHIIVDEIHERDCNADFLLIILKNLLLAQPELRLVLMSATLNAELFSAYFNNCPVLRIPGFTHPVTVYYLEDVLSVTNFGKDKLAERLNKLDSVLEEEDADETFMDDQRQLAAEEAELLGKYHRTVDQDEVDYLMIERLLGSICSKADDSGAVLVFLPGWEDITRCRDRLMASSIFSDKRNFQVLSLHSMVPMYEQKKVFEKPPPGVRKIVLATNIAESSITIDDVVYVIDTGRMKEKSYDPYTNVSTLQTAWVSKASARQRQGRAGRCSPGVCYHLFSKVRAASLADFQPPEMKRTPLEEVCLKVKLLQPDGDIRQFLSQALDPPLDITIRNAITLLQDIGAVTAKEELTELGMELGSLPVHPSTSKMLLLSILLNCLDPALTIACAAGYREPFVLPISHDQKKQAAAARYRFGSTYGGYSDHLAVVAAFEGWQEAKRSGHGQANKFCTQNFLSGGVMLMLEGMRKQLLRELVQKGFVTDAHTCSLNAGDPGIVRAILAACLYPSVGKLLPPVSGGQKGVVQIARGEKVRIHPSSTITQLTMPRQLVGHEVYDKHILVFDEITRGEAMVYIRNGTIVKPHSLLFICTELSVAPLDDQSSSGDDDDDDDPLDPAEKQVRLMEVPDNKIALVVDRWLKYQTTSVEAAQIYCLRERLLAALYFKVKNPTSNLPEMLAASVFALACILSYEGALDLGTVDSGNHNGRQFPVQHQQQRRTFEAQQQQQQRRTSEAQQQQQQRRTSEAPQQQQQQQQRRTSEAPQQQQQQRRTSEAQRQESRATFNFSSRTRFTQEQQQEQYVARDDGRGRNAQEDGRSRNRNSSSSKQEWKIVG